MKEHFCRWRAMGVNDLLHQVMTDEIILSTIRVILVSSKLLLEGAINQTLSLKERKQFETWLVQLRYAGNGSYHK
jgi:hypothetical protein